MFTQTEHHLSKTYYNLASVALHDWQSYATMRVLAKDKLALNIMDDHLPAHTLEQGRDILEIVRNLDNFVAEFTYNLNNQVFLQINSPNKHLDTVNISHLANSLRTHGPGTANTIVNFAYKFLKKKIMEFSSFLFEEQVKSRLSKEIRILKRKQDSLNTTTKGTATTRQGYRYSYEQGSKLGNDIKAMGAIADGITRLDQFRVLITQIGNVLG